MSQCIENLPHICGSSDALQVFEGDDGYTGYCFSCGTYVPNPYGDKPKDYKPVAIKKSNEQLAKEVYEIYEHPIVPIPIRGLDADTLTHYGARVGLSQADGETPEILYTPYTRNSEVVAYKAKLLNPKKIWSVGVQKDVDPFGWDLAAASGNNKLVITEGEADAMALYQMIKRENKGGEWEHIIPAVISIQHGAASAVKDLMRIQHEAEHLFKEIILGVENPGYTWSKRINIDTSG